MLTAAGGHDCYSGSAELPAVRQEFVDAASLVGGQPGQHVLEVGVRVMPVHTRRLNQAHDGGCPLARAQATGEQPVVAVMRNFA